MNEPILPFVIKPPNECPVCGGKLVLVTVEFTMHPIGPNGNVINTLGGGFNSKIICPSCNKKFNVINDRFNLRVMPAYAEGRTLTIDFEDSDYDYNNPFQS